MKENHSRTATHTQRTFLQWKIKIVHIWVHQKISCIRRCNKCWLLQLKLQRQQATSGKFGNGTGNSISPGKSGCARTVENCCKIAGKSNQHLKQFSMEISIQSNFQWKSASKAISNGKCPRFVEDPAPWRLWNLTLSWQTSTLGKLTKVLEVQKKSMEKTDTSFWNSNRNKIFHGKCAEIVEAPPCQADLKLNTG